MKTAIREIYEDWDIDAKKEDISRYYFQPSDLDQVLKGSRPIVVGRKGTGKTAMFEYIKTLSGPKCHVSANSFTGLPITSLLEFRDEGMESGSDYISLWTFIILKELCKLVARSESAKGLGLSEIRKIFPPFADSKLKSAFDGSSNFRVKILEYLEISDEKTDKKVSLLEKNEALMSAVETIQDSSKYYILFDSLDDNFQGAIDKAEGDIEKSKYYSCIIGLIKSIENLTSHFSKIGLHIFPIAFISGDVFDLLKGRDKGKSRYSIKYLEWDEDELKSFIAYRLRKAARLPERECPTFEDAWRIVFSDELISVGNRQVHTFDYITTRTLFRPRDYITYIKDVCEVAHRRDFEVVRPGVVYYTESWYSEYFWQEMVDEVGPLVPPIDKILKIIEKIRKPSFEYNEFDEILDRYIDIKFLNETELLGLSSYRILEILYNYSAIGNINKGSRIFKYRNPKSSFDFDLPIVVHRGLDVVLGINARAEHQRRKSMRREQQWSNSQASFDFTHIPSKYD